MKSFLRCLLLSLCLTGPGLLPSAALAQGSGNDDTPPDMPPDGAPGGAVEALAPARQTPRYLVSFMKSDTSSAIRSATVVTVTNQYSGGSCDVSVEWFNGPHTNPSCITTLSIPSGATEDFCSRDLPGPITSCNSICSPELTFAEGRARVNSATDTSTTFCSRIGVSARTYYTTGSTDSAVTGITDAKIVKVNKGNAGD